MTRSEEREQAFIVVFEKIFNPELSLDEMKDAAIESELFTLDGFAYDLAQRSIEKEEDVDEVISKYLKGGWKLMRLPRVCLALLRVAVTEIMFFDDIPDSVSANEAVELAKKYSAEGDAAFINGVLGSIIRAKDIC